MTMQPRNSGIPAMKRTRSFHAAFTLVELLTVIAISAVLFTIIILPLIQSFALVRQGQALADAQDAGRRLTERIARETANATAVRGAVRVPLDINGTEILVPSTSQVVNLPAVQNDGTVRIPRQEVEVILPYTRLDLVMPAEAGERRNGGFVDPVTGKEDPTLRNPKGQIQLPIAPGATLVRYFVGPRDPFAPYNNPYDGLLMSRGGGRDNLFVLYRAEVQPRVFDSATNTFVTNTGFFEDDAGLPLLDDPTFFTPNLTAAGVIIDNDAKAIRIRNWLRSAIVQTEVSRYDMIQVAYNKANRRVENTGGIPRVSPLVQFRPTRVDNEPAEGMVAVRPGEEMDNGLAVAPDVFTTDLGLWSNATVRTWPLGWNGAAPAANEYLVGRTDANNGLPGFPGGFSIYAYDPDASPVDYTSGVELFDLDVYTRALNRGVAYPFTRAVAAANNRTGWLGNARLRELFTPYYFDSARGRITASFGLEEVGQIVPEPVGNPDNLPLVAAGAAETPRTATDLTGNFYDAKFNPVNAKFNKVYNLWETDTANTLGIRNIDQSRIHRFIDLRVTPQQDGTPSPLDPTFGFRVGIVPGSETVIGPDQQPGPNYGQPIRYVRVNSTPGLNQYRINYTNLAEPTDYALLGFGGTALAGFDRNNYDAQNLISAVFQPQFRVGYIQLNSDPNIAIPVGNFRINYRFQFTGTRTGSAAELPGAKTDLFAVDYDSRELMSILLTIRNYPQSNAPNPQNVTLKATAKVRNYIR